MKNRIIKFRGRNIHTGEWLYGDYHREGKTHYITKPKDFLREYAPIEFIVDEKTVGHFTGMLDRNGKEIYEGDIIRTDVGACNFADGACGTVTFLRAVEYDEEKAGFYPFLEEHGMYSHYDWKIIGNMHDRELTYEGKKYKPVLVSDEKGVCEKCPLYGKCHLGFSNYICEIFDGLQLLDDNKVVILQEIHDTPSLISDNK